MKILLIITAIIFISPLILIIIEAVIAPIGAGNDFKNPSRDVVKLMNDKPDLTYVVMGDSTAAGVGTDYENGIAISTAKHLSETNNVSMYNLGISGARVNDVLTEQITYLKDENIKADLILISIGGNDVTHITSLESLKTDTQKIIDNLIKINCNTKIIFTGSPNVGTSKRFAQPLRWIVEMRSNTVNDIFIDLIDKNKLTLAPIFKDTTEPFKNNDDLFYKDKFHPNEKGYVIWSEIINKAIDDAMNNQNGHCN